MEPVSDGREAWVVWEYEQSSDDRYAVAVILDEEQAEAAGAEGPVKVYDGPIESRVVYRRSMFVATDEEHRSLSKVSHWVSWAGDPNPSVVQTRTMFPWDDGFETGPVETSNKHATSGFERFYQTRRDDGEVVKSWKRWEDAEGVQVDVWGTDKNLVAAEFERLREEHGVK